MTNPPGMADFFSLEAGEYLDRLTAMLGDREPPPPAELVRFTRALRGCALMANQQPIARAASGLEAIARAYRDGRQPWTPATAERVRRALETFRLLVGHAAAWTEADTATAERLARELDADGAVERSPAQPPSAGLDAGVRAFVARESASIAAALDAAARAFRTGGPAADALQAVSHRMQSLQGLAALAELSPLPEFLDAIARVAARLASQPAPRRDSAEVFEAAAAALTRAARDVVQHGHPDPDAPEARRFADLVLREFVRGTEVTVEILFPDDGAPGIAQLGVSPAVPPARRALGRLELVSHAEHLTEVADALERAGSPTQRDLRLLTAVGALRALGDATGDDLVEDTSRFARIAAAVASCASDAPAIRAFIAALREASALLRSATAATGTSDTRRGLGELERRLRSAWPGGATAPERDAWKAPPGEAAGAAPPEPPIVPIETLLLDAPADLALEPVVPIELLAPDGEPALVETADLAGSFATYQRLLAADGAAPASLEVLLGLEAAPAPSPASPPAPAEEPPVAIGELLYRGRAALARAAEIRGALRAALAGGATPAELRPLLDELLDLVDLALAGGT